MLVKKPPSWLSVEYKKHKHKKGNVRYTGDVVCDYEKKAKIGLEEQGGAAVCSYYDNKLRSVWPC